MKTGGEGIAQNEWDVKMDELQRKFQALGQEIREEARLLRETMLAQLELMHRIRDSLNQASHKGRRIGEILRED